MRDVTSVLTIKKWEYDIYRELAKKYSYSFYVYQLNPESKEQAKYLQTRSHHDTSILNNQYFYG